MDKLVSFVRSNLNSYNYPAFRISLSHEPRELNFGGGWFGRFSPSDKPTALEIDRHHHALLHDENPHKNLAGLASVIYWGFATFGDNYARNRVGWFLNGRRDKAPVAADAAQRSLCRSRIDLGARRFDRALSNLGSLGQLGRTPFASKVVAFLDPDRAGVYDNRIMLGLRDHPALAGHKGGPLGIFHRCQDGVGSVLSPSIGARYQAWCEALQKIATSANAAAIGAPVRAIDVERAIFAAVAAK